MVRQILNLLRHWRETKTALSTLSFLYDSHSDALDVLGGLTDEEMQAVCSWASSLTNSLTPSLPQSSTHNASTYLITLQHMPTTSTFSFPNTSSTARVTPKRGFGLP